METKKKVRYVTVTGKTDTLTRYEHYTTDTYHNIRVPDSVPENATNEEIIEAIQDEIDELDWELSNDDDHWQGTSYNIEVDEEEDEEEDSSESDDDD
jgi:hypothetical protein